MQTEQSDAISWAIKEFMAADLGDARREARLRQIAAAVCLHPHGRLTEVFLTAKELNAAYDFIENDAICSADIQRASSIACAKRCSEHSLVIVAEDGSSLSLPDHLRKKSDLGSVGSYKEKGRGLKLINAVAISVDGVLLGNLSMRWWARSEEKRAPRAMRKVEDKETVYWHEAIEESSSILNSYAPKTVAWYQLDREADSWTTLLKLNATGNLFTVRSSHDRRISVSWTEQPKYLRQYLRIARPMGYYQLNVKAGPNRTARVAKMEIKSATVNLVLKDKRTKKQQSLTVNAVSCCEISPVPKGETPISWCLLTNKAIKTCEDAYQVVQFYTYRWTIEQFYRTWKEGLCHVEDSQLQYADHVIKWSTILAAVAMKAERLKQVSRTTPDVSALTELSAAELEALLVLKKKYKSRNEVIPETEITIGQAVLWLAELGGYTGKSSGGPPGTVTISRGLERVAFAAMGIEAYKATLRSDQTSQPTKNSARRRKVSPS
jgi:hypothetical protein